MERSSKKKKSGTARARRSTAKKTPKTSKKTPSRKVRKTPILVSATDPLTLRAAGPAANPKVASTQAQAGSPTRAPQAPSRAPAPGRELPQGHGDNLIRLLVRDPHCLFTYWEIRPDFEAGALARLGGNRAEVRSILRVYDLTEGASGSSFFDITLQNMVTDWYIGVRPNHSYVVEIGLLHRDGRFIALARSNQVTAPRDCMSDVLDEEWVGIDFDQIYALSGGFQVGLSSAELKTLMRQRLHGAITSGSGGLASSPSSPVKLPKDRKFWFKLDCELIVYGATEPDAEVTVNGERIALRSDGTFSLRYALPDGRVDIDARATSADRMEERKIAPSVERETATAERIIRADEAGAPRA